MMQLNASSAMITGIPVVDRRTSDGSGSLMLIPTTAHGKLGVGLGARLGMPVNVVANGSAIPLGDG